MLIPSRDVRVLCDAPSLSRGVNANSQRYMTEYRVTVKSIKRGEC